MDRELRETVNAARTQVKTLRNVARGLLPVLASLEEALNDLDPQPEEAQGNGNNRETTAAAK